MKKFSYDDMTPIYALSDNERKIAIGLNAKGCTEGLSEGEYEQLKSLYEIGVKILEVK